MTRLRAEVARLAAPPVDQALDEALRLLIVESSALSTSKPIASNLTPTSPTSLPPPSTRWAAARAFLETVVATGGGRGRGGPDLLAAEVAAAVAAAHASGTAAANTAATAPTAPSPPTPSLPPVWEGEPLAPRDLLAGANDLVRAAQEQVAVLRGAAARYEARGSGRMVVVVGGRAWREGGGKLAVPYTTFTHISALSPNSAGSPTITARLAEREALAASLVELEGLCRELVGCER